MGVATPSFPRRINSLGASHTFAFSRQSQLLRLLPPVTGAVPATRIGMTHRTNSLWHATHQVRHFPPLNHHLAVDVAIVGGGVSGVTAALLFARAGRRVALIERDRLGSGETGYTTSHLTEAVDARYQNVVSRFGEERARLVAQASREAIDRIERFASELALDCGFERLPGYLYSERES